MVAGLDGVVHWRRDACHTEHALSQAFNEAASHKRRLSDRHRQALLDDPSGNRLHREWQVTVSGMSDGFMAIWETRKTSM
jgi:hypothetical protein